MNDAKILVKGFSRKLPSKKEPTLHWMRKPRWFTWDRDYAEKSIFPWAESFRSEKYQDPPQWELSILGAINGPLALTGYVLVATYDTETQEIISWSIKKKWW